LCLCLCPHMFMYVPKLWDVWVRVSVYGHFVFVFVSTYVYVCFYVVVCLVTCFCVWAFRVCVHM
jgi:hypothetical protein